MEDKRKSIPKRIRFEVFKRDKFTCQYCGRMAPDVVLEVDHIEPVSKGGSNDILNLVTACKDCNRGKGAKELSDNSTVRKQQQQLADLAEKNEQLEMILEWRDGLKDVREREIDAFEETLVKGTIGDGHLNEAARKMVAKMLYKHNIVDLLDALDEAILNYYDGTQASIHTILKKADSIAYFRKNPMNQSQKDVFYLRKILTNRLDYVNEKVAYTMIKKALENGVDFNEIKMICSSCRNWSEFKSELEELT